MKISWHNKHFSQLAAAEFHEILKVRINVFVVEQNCPYPEIDGKDLDAWHVFGVNENNNVVGVSRILRPGISYDEPSVGRVATLKEARMTGAGMQMMQFVMEEIKSLFPNENVRISAQEYLKGFYEKFDFVKVSESYLEDDIPHIEMLMSRKNQD